MSYFQGFTKEHPHPRMAATGSEGRCELCGLGPDATIHTTYKAARDMSDQPAILPMPHTPTDLACACGWNRKGHCFSCEDHSPVVCLDCQWNGCSCQLLAQACPVCDGRCADV